MQYAGTLNLCVTVDKELRFVFLSTYPVYQVDMKECNTVTTEN